MRSMLTATLIFVAAGASASAQMTAPSTAGAKPKPVATVPIRPALQTPADTANAMAQAERLAIQSDLAWVGQYNGAISGEVSERMVAAIKEFQKERGGKQTGVLNPQERSVLAETARRRQENVGWKIVNDPGTGVRLGVPTKLVPQHPLTPTAPNGVLPPGLSRFSLRGASRPIPPRRNSPSRKRRNLPAARSNTPWSNRISSCCRACRA